MSKSRLMVISEQRAHDTAYQEYLDVTKQNGAAIDQVLRSSNIDLQHPESVSKAQYAALYHQYAAAKEAHEGKAEAIAGAMTILQLGKLVTQSQHQGAVTMSTPDLYDLRDHTLAMVKSYVDEQAERGLQQAEQLRISKLSPLDRAIETTIHDKNDRIAVAAILNREIKGKGLSYTKAGVRLNNLLEDVPDNFGASIDQRRYVEAMQVLAHKQQFETGHIDQTLAKLSGVDTASAHQGAAPAKPHNIAAAALAQLNPLGAPAQAAELPPQPPATAPKADAPDAPIYGTGDIHYGKPIDIGTNCARINAELIVLSANHNGQHFDRQAVKDFLQQNVPSKDHYTSQDLRALHDRAESNPNDKNTISAAIAVLTLENQFDNARKAHKTHLNVFASNDQVISHYQNSYIKAATYAPAVDGQENQLDQTQTHSLTDEAHPSKGGIRLYARKDGKYGGAAPRADEVPVFASEDQVRELQIKLGFTGKDVDGHYGPQTHAANLAAAAKLGKTAKDYDFTAGDAFTQFLAALGSALSSSQQTAQGAVADPAKQAAAADPASAAPVPAALKTALDQANAVLGEKGKSGFLKDGVIDSTEMTTVKVGLEAMQGQLSASKDSVSPQLQNLVNGILGKLADGGVTDTDATVGQMIKNIRSTAAVVVASK